MKLQELRKKFIHRLNTWLLKKSWNAALAEAKKINERTDQKIWIVLVHGNFEAIPKQNFKRYWHKNPKMKFRSLEQWQKKAYEYKGDRTKGNTAGAEQ